MDTNVDRFEQEVITCKLCQQNKTTYTVTGLCDWCYKLYGAVRYNPHLALQLALTYVKPVSQFERAKTILLTLHWLTNLEQTVGKEKFLDLMPNGFGGRNDLRKLLADDLPPELAYLKDLYTAPEELTSEIPPTVPE